MTDHKVATPELLVIGAGPAGLTAASVAAEAGVQVTVIDESKIGGGQFYKQPSSTIDVPSSLAGDRQISDGKRLIDRAITAGANLVRGARIWGAFTPVEFAMFDGSQTIFYRPQHTIVATGAYERGMPVPGWTLPGVMTTGAAQSLLKSYDSIPPGRILVAGNGPLNFQVALELRSAGANVVAVCESAIRPGTGQIADIMSMGLSGPKLTLTGAQRLLALWRRGVDIYYDRVLKKIAQANGGLVATLASARHDGSQKTLELEVDVVCMGYGFQPNNAILRTLGCSHEYSDSMQQLVTVCSNAGETSVPGVFAVGDCVQLRGAPSALDQGTLAAHAVVRSLRGELTIEQRKDTRRALRRLRRHSRFQSALWNIFAAPRIEYELADPQTIICRCENVRLGDITAALKESNITIGNLKRNTRLGMGHCQGRYCASVAASILSRQYGDSLDEYSFFAPRNPLQPVRIADIVATGGD